MCKIKNNIIKLYPSLYYIFGFALIILISTKPILISVYKDLYGINDHQAINMSENIHTLIFIVIQAISFLTLYLSIILIKNPIHNLNRKIPITFAILSSISLLLFIYFILLVTGLGSGILS